QVGRPQFTAVNRSENNHQIEVVGRELRKLMPFIKQSVSSKKEVVVNGPKN
ncbi:MAG: ketol-acid reductoisomerase, partial [Bacillota bacterium]|nr:ketol-acid reductoisomerase [Bacillota bacterium]